MIEGQNDSEARDDNEIVQEKIEQESETDVTLTNCRE